MSQLPRPGPWAAGPTPSALLCPLPFGTRNKDFGTSVFLCSVPHSHVSPPQAVFAVRPEKHLPALPVWGSGVKGFEVG